MMKIKSSQRLRVIRYINNEPSIQVFCTYGKLDQTFDISTQGAIQEALSYILKEPCKGISARFRNMSLQVDIL